MPGRDPRRPVVARPVLAGLALAAVLAVAMDPRPARAADQTLELDVTLNGAATQKIGEFTLRDGVLLARPEELGELGLRVPKDAPRTADGLVAVVALPGVRVTLDAAAQAVRITASDGQLVPSRLGAGAAPDAGVRLDSGTGATLNYEVSETFGEGRDFASGLFDLRLFSPWGVASTGLLAYAGDNPAVAPRQHPQIRLDSTYVYSDFAGQRRYRLGDFITGGLSWTRPVRFGGAQVTHDFSMRPDLVTFPLPLVEGSAAVPSTVDVLVNGAKVLSSQVPPGPFQVPQLPVLSGAGTVAMTVTDALGRQVTTTLPFYASPTLLAPGLKTYSLEAGVVRRNWGVVSNDYGAGAGSATWRAGLSNSLTVEAHAEGTTDQAMAGAGLVAEVFHFAVVNLALGASSASGHQGGILSVGFDRLAHGFSFGASGVFATSSYRDIAAMNGDSVPVRQISANAGLSFGRFGWGGLAFTQTDRKALSTAQVFAPSSGPGGTTPPGQTVTAGVFPFAAAQHARVLTASYSVQVGHVYAFASAFHDFARDRGDGLVIGLTVPLGRRSSLTASVDAGPPSHAQIEAQRSANVIGDFGYQLFASAGGVDHEFAQAQYKSPWALLAVGVDRTGGLVTGRLDVQGALSFLDGRPFASNLINDSFAVVDTGGVAGVPVLYENRDAGRTDGGGRRLVPDLRSFDVNHISIDPTNLPADAIASVTTREVRPPDRSGVVVRFPVRTLRAALVVLRDERGQPIPVGAKARLRSNGAVSPVGYDGETFVEDLGPQNQLDLQLPDGSACAVTFAYALAKGDIPRLGPLTCRRTAP